MSKDKEQMDKPKVDDSPKGMHLEIMANREGEKASKMKVFKGYVKLGFSKEEALSMAGLSLLKKEDK